MPADYVPSNKKKVKVLKYRNNFFTFLLPALRDWQNNTNIKYLYVFDHRLFLFNVYLIAIKTMGPSQGNQTHKHAYIYIYSTNYSSATP